ncbi:molybdenum-binding protein, partial [Halarcobacter bivalviorum]
VQDIVLGEVNAQISLKLKSGNILTSTITNSAVQNLGLELFDEVVAVIKSSNVLISNQSEFKISARNILKGEIEQINQSKVNSEVIINIGNEDKVVAVITTESINNMKLEVGSKVDAIIKESDIMIGR